MSPFIDEGVPIEAPQSSPRWHINIPGFLGLFAGLALMGFGTYLLFVATSYVGAFLFLLSAGLGVSVIGMTRDFVENRRYAGGPRRGGYWVFLGVTGIFLLLSRRYVRDERKVEDEEDKRRASGEED